MQTDVYPNFSATMIGVNECTVIKLIELFYPTHQKVDPVRTDVEYKCLVQTVELLQLNKAKEYTRLLLRTLCVSSTLDCAD